MSFDCRWREKDKDDAAATEREGTTAATDSHKFRSDRAGELVPPLVTTSKSVPSPPTQQDSRSLSSTVTHNAAVSSSAAPHDPLFTKAAAAREPRDAKQDQEGKTAPRETGPFLRKIEPTLWQPHQHVTFGTQPLGYLDLCAMQGKKQADGYAVDPFVFG